MSRTWQARLTRLLLYMVIVAAAIVVALPFIWLITSSFKTNEQFFTSIFLPLGEGLLGIDWDSLTTRHFQTLFFELGFARHLLVSVFVASVTSILATLCSAMAGFAIARYRFRGRGLARLIILLMLIVPPPLILAPTYQLLFNINLLDTFTGLMLPALAPAFGVFLFRQAMLSSVPMQLLEAARIDGCGELRLFFVIALPLVKPMIGTFLLITFLAMWNNFIWPQVVLQDPGKFPLAVAIAQLQRVYYQEYGLLMAGTLISILPVMLLFLLLQGEFISGLTSGAVKG